MIDLGHKLKQSLVEKSAFSCVADLRQWLALLKPEDFPGDVARKFRWDPDKEKPPAASLPLGVSGVAITKKDTFPVAHPCLELPSLAPLMRRRIKTIIPRN